MFYKIIINYLIYFLFILEDYLLTRFLQRIQGYYWKLYKYYHILMLEHFIGRFFKKKHFIDNEDFLNLVNFDSSPIQWKKNIHTYVTFIDTILWEVLLTKKLEDYFKGFSKCPPSFYKQKVALFLKFFWLPSGECLWWRSLHTSPWNSSSGRSSRFCIKSTLLSYTPDEKFQSNQVRLFTG